MPMYDCLCFASFEMWTFSIDIDCLHLKKKKNHAALKNHSEKKRHSPDLHGMWSCSHVKTTLVPGIFIIEYIKKEMSLRNLRFIIINT